MLKLATLGNVLGDIHREMQRVWRTNLQLPDNLPVLVEYRAAHLPEADRVKIENTVGLGKTGLLDTHPSAAERTPAPPPTPASRSAMNRRAGCSITSTP